MNLELYIARKVLNYKQAKDSISGPIAKIAVIGIALSIMIIICTIFIVTGFKSEVSNKLTGFGGHIQISKLSSNVSYEMDPISMDQDFYPALDTIEGIKNIQVFASKAGIIKTDDIVQAVVLKGVDKDFSWEFFKSCLVEGDIINITDSVKSTKVIISKKLANTLKLGLGDKFSIYFIQERPRGRRLEICGIYQTTLEEYDQLYIIGDIKQIRTLNGWEKDEVSGFEVNLEDFDYLEWISRYLKVTIESQFLEDGSILHVSNIKDKNQMLFDWMALFNFNVAFIIFIMLIVAGMNIISGLLIVVLEKTRMIGILKSLGTPNVSVKKIFIYIASFITLRGLLWGNLLGLLICFLQFKFKIITLDPSAYFLNAVPVNFNFFYLSLINIGAFAVIFLVLLIPSTIISSITPAETIKYE